MLKLASATLATMIACTPEPTGVAQVEQAAGCNDWMCGTNTWFAHGRFFWDARKDGLPNEQGVAVEGMEDKEGTRLELSVDGGRIRGIYDSGAVLEGEDLGGAIIWFSIDDHTTWFAVRIEKVESIPYAIPKSKSSIETYLMLWSADPATNEWENVCSEAVAKPDLGMNGEHTLVFERDRIDAKKKLVYDVDANWFNLGCAGSALAKLQLLGHTEVGAADGYTTTLDERQTLLKMFTADYCGNGKAFTVERQPLDWMDDHGWMAYGYPDQTLEARWTKDGASCLTTPRLAANPSPVGDSQFPNLAEMIKTECGGELPSCGDDVTELDGHHVITANPVNPQNWPPQ
jgi:hypothetical protein